MTDFLQKAAEILGEDNLLLGPDMAAFSTDWTGHYSCTPLAVARPKSTEEVSALMRLASDNNTPVVPVSGNTGLTGATMADGALMISLQRMNKIRDIRPASRLAVVEAGVVLANLHEAVDAHDLVFPLTFGARGSAMVGGALATNAGGSNVVRYGSTRGLCMGLEVVLASGEVLNLMSELHKDNSGYDLKDLFIGAEGTLGLITGAVVKLFPKPRAYATAMVAAPDLNAALILLNRLQSSTGGAVEAFEYMPAAYIQRHMAHFPKARAPFETLHDVNILVEVGATSPRDAEIAIDGSIPVVRHLEDTLAELLEEGLVIDAVVANSETQRREMWARRESAAEITFSGEYFIDSDIAVPLDKVPTLLARLTQRLAEFDPDARELAIAHLGDGNVHHTAYPSRADPVLKDAVKEAIEEEVQNLGGSFSAEHGIGVSKLNSMRRRKDPVALAVMSEIKKALDPKGIMNPGKVLPQ